MAKRLGNPISIQLYGIYEESVSQKKKNLETAAWTLVPMFYHSYVQLRIVHLDGQLRETGVLTGLWKWLLSLAFLFAPGPGWV